MAVVIKLKELAEAQGLTISQVSRRTGLTMQMVRRYWYNETSSVELASLEKIADLLNLEPGELLARKEEKRSVGGRRKKPPPEEKRGPRMMTFIPGPSMVGSTTFTCQAEDVKLQEIVADCERTCNDEI